MVSILILGAVGFSQMSTPAYAGDIDPLQGVYQFDEKTGTTAVDGAGHIGAGTLTNMVLSTDRILGGIGAAFSGALHFNDDDTDEYVIVNPVTSFPTDAITAEFWINSDETGPGTPLSYAVTGTDNEFLIFNVNSLQIWIQGTPFSTGEDVADGTWHHVAVTWAKSDGIIKLYVDGTLTDTSGANHKDFSLEAGGSLVFGQEQDTVGGDFQTSQICDCTMDEVRIWDEVLDAEAIAESANLGEARNTAGWDTELSHEGFASVIIWTSAFHDAEGDTVPWRMMRVNTEAAIDITTIDCAKKNAKKIDCPGAEPDAAKDGILFRGLSPKGTTLSLFDPDEGTIAGCGGACDGDLVEVDIVVGDFVNPRANRPATAHFQVVLDIDEELGSNVHQH